MKKVLMILIISVISFLHADQYAACNKYFNTSKKYYEKSERTYDPQMKIYYMQKANYWAILFQVCVMHKDCSW